MLRTPTLAPIHFWPPSCRTITLHWDSDNLFEDLENRDVERGLSGVNFTIRAVPGLGG